MEIVKPSYRIDYPNQEQAKGILRNLELVARTCYKSEDRISEGSDARLITVLRDKGHEAMLEHEIMRVHFICDRGVSHELVRHRLCAFAQESTRYCDYKSNGIQVILPPGIVPIVDKEAYAAWESAMCVAEKSYVNLRNAGFSAQIARSVLPTCLKTEIWVTANLREWRHIFQLRTAKAAHPQMRELMVPLLAETKTLIPVIFDDLGGEE